MAYPTDPIYKLINDPDTGELQCIKTQTGDSEPYHVRIFPLNTENRDYQEYLEWVAEGNTADAAD